MKHRHHDPRGDVTALGRAHGAARAWISPIDDILSMYVRRTSARCRVIEAGAEPVPPWTAGYLLPGGTARMNTAAARGQPMQMPRPQAGPKGGVGIPFLPLW